MRMLINKLDLEVAEKPDRLVVYGGKSGLSAMDGAQPLAISMNEGVGLIAEFDPERAKKRLEKRRRSQRRMNAASGFR